MNLYEELLDEASSQGVNVVEKKFKSNAKGLCKGCKIGISSELTTCEKKCTLAEELGHYHTTVGDIIEQADDAQIKQENLARSWAVEKLISLDKIINAVKSGNSRLYELADFLDVEENFLRYSLEYYQRKLGINFPLHIDLF